MSMLVRPAPNRASRSKRRLTILCVGALFAVLLAADFIVAPRDDILAGAVRLITVLTTLGTMVILMTRSPAWFGANAPDKEQDEREIRLRDRAYFHAYVIFAGAATMATFYLGQIGPDFDLWLPATPDQWWTLSWVVLLAALMLPSAVLAWLAPNPPAED